MHYEYIQIDKTPSSRRLAVITGATSGIGKAFAEYFAAHDYDLFLTGRRREIILQVAFGLKATYGVNIDVAIADLSRNEHLAGLLQDLGNNRKIEILVNNAGYGMDIRFSEDEIDHQLDMLKVHVNAPLLLINKVLPVMMENKSGIIINVSSLAAYMPTAGSAMYTSTKSFLKTFSESLHMDVMHNGIRVLCLCPGFTHSDFHKNLNGSGDNNGLTYWMNPSAVVEYSINCLNRGQVVCIPGIANRTLCLLATTLPRSLYYQIAGIMEKKIRRQNRLPDTTCRQAVN